ncbi:unnamed protein product [Rhodiola kirilowii]
MVKGVVGEETRLKSAEDRLVESGAQSEIGLVIGRLSSSLDRGFLYDLVPTPANDAGEPAFVIVEAVRDDKKKGGKAKVQSDSSASLVIDNDWIAEHARQVSRMLPGGMKVVGIYIWISESSFKGSANMLCQTLKGVAAAGPSSDSDSNERLLIHISYSPRRWVCRNCAITSSISSSSLRPCDFKMGRIMNSLLTFRSTYNFDLRLPIFLERSDGRTMTDSLRQGISVFSKELKDAKALVDGILAAEDEACKLDGEHEVEFLLPFMKDTQAQGHSQKEVVGVVQFSGSVSSYAYLNSKEPLSEALADIKNDIITSLHSRLDIVCDEADGDMDPEVDDNEPKTEKHVAQISLQSARKGCHLILPQRVFVPWLGGTYICDYLLASESVEVIKDHCVELMSMQAPTDVTNILKPEAVAPILAAGSFWDIANQLGTSTKTDHSRKRNKGTGREESTKKPLDMSIVAAIFILFAAVLASLVWYYFIPRHHHRTQQE